MSRYAYGCSKLLHFYLENTPDHGFAGVVDRNYAGSSFCGLDVLRPHELAERKTAETRVVVFAVSNRSLTGILTFLATLGLRLGEEVSLYASLFAEPFRAAVRSSLDWELDPDLLQFSTGYTLNSRKPVHTTICGTWFFLEALKRTATVAGDIAEVGAYECGNVMGALQSPVWPREKRYFVLDSFEGFPTPSAVDPATIARGHYTPESTLDDILAPLTVYPQTRVIKGFVPQTFAELPADGRYALVFYDCDLYQPALDTYTYFWDRLSSGGLMLVHDYFSEPGGYGGVKAATDLFFADRTARRGYFWHNTIAAFVKP